MTTARVGDLEVTYAETGDDTQPTVVLVHGLAEDHGSWQPQLDGDLALHLYAYDLRGHGGTTLGNADGTVEQLAGDLLRFLETVTGPAHCVGFSLGGTVVLAAAASGSPLVTTATVLGTSSVVGRAAVGFYEQRIALACSGDADALAEALRADTAAGLHRGGADLDALTQRRLAAVGAGAGYVNAAAAMARLHEQPLTPRLGEVTCPVTVVGGSADAFCPRKAADILLDAMPRASYIELPDAGHLMNTDNPDAVSTSILRAIGRTRT